MDTADGHDREYGAGRSDRVARGHVTERSKWKREQESSRRAMARADAVHDAFRVSRSYQLRYELAITAGQGVLDEAVEAFRAMRDIRDLLARGRGIGSAEYKTLVRRYGDALRRLQGEMRAELDAGHVRLSGGS